MNLIVGLGNPGAEYASTRHNVGFMLTEAIRTAHGLPSWSKKSNGVVSKGRIGGEDIILLQPQTYMNLSGPCVQAVAAFFKVAPAQMLVVHDELDLPLAALRTKVGGSDAGHNGLKSITQALGTPEYPRLRIGIGRPVHKTQVSDYVLEPFSAAETPPIADVLTALAAAMPQLALHPKETLAKLAKPT